MSRHTFPQFKFALRSFSGKPLRFFRVEADYLESQVATPVKNPSHHILVVDRSGSMYGDMAELRSQIEKIFTIDEFNDPSLRVSLISYSSRGDVKLHFSKVTVADVMKADSKYLREIRSLHATALTCISQGLAMAETLIDDKETTCISLHTDGYANDSSPYAEQREIQTVVAALKSHPNVFVNTVAYRDWCDFNLMSSISNQLSGSCIQARSIRQVYDALYDTTKLLAGQMAPALEITKGSASYVCFISKRGRKVLGSTDNIVVRGLGAEDDRIAYRFFETGEAEYNSSQVPEVTNSNALFAFCRTQISEGCLNAAKYALVATRHADLLEKHSRALVSSDVAAFAEAVEEVLFTPYDPNIHAVPHYKETADWGLPVTGPSVLAVLSVLDKHAKSLSVNLKAMLADYKRRGLKRIPGVRKEDGSVELPTVESRYRSASEDWISVNGFDLNRNTATVNMLVSQPIDLFPVGGNTRIASVSGVDLSGLKAFNNYTLVGDGLLNVKSLEFRTDDKRCWTDLKNLGVVSGTYKPNETFAIDFSGMPLVDFEASFDAIGPEEIKDVARLTVLAKILAGMIKGESTSFTGDQVAELKKHYLSPALYFSPPTTNEFSDLQEAIAKGQVDSRLSYKIDVGYPALTSVSKLKSGNEYLQRRFTLEFHGKDVAKPTLDQVTLPGGKMGLKKLTARTQLDEVDNLSMPVYEGVFGFGHETEITRLLELASCVDAQGFLNTIRTETDRDTVVAVVSDTQRQIERTIESFYDRVRPLAFYVGATGLVPDSLNATAMTAEQFMTAYPDAKLSKAEKEEGTFFVLPNGLVLTVYVKSEYFTTTPAAA